MDTLRTGRRIGAYRLEHRLGEGGTGEVWLARDERGERFALKFPRDGGSLSRLRDGALAQARIRHRNVVPVLGVYTLRSPEHVVYGYCAGGTLRSRLERGPLGERALAALLRDVLAGLEAIHAAGQLHLDLKPENVVCSGSGVWKLTDLGAGPPDDELERSAGLETGTIEVALTLRYAAPELLHERRRWPGADLYSCGLVLFEAATGKLPTGHGLPSETARCPAWCDLLYRRLCAPVDRRIESAAAARLLLDELLRRAGARAAPASVIVTADDPPPRTLPSRGMQRIVTASSAGRRVARPATRGGRVRRARNRRSPAASGASETEASGGSAGEAVFAFFLFWLLLAALGGSC
ncbi:MAG: serine/threonine protein kinase [Planctomycetota bacterium]|nr:MAG: serine/threonine protein kinase [Planctomycetota bacterium]